MLSLLDYHNPKRLNEWIFLRYEYSANKFQRNIIFSMRMSVIVVRFAHCVSCVLTWAALRIIEDIRDNKSNEYSNCNQRPSIIRRFSATFDRERGR